MTAALPAYARLRLVAEKAVFDPLGIAHAAARVREEAYIVQDPVSSAIGVAFAGEPVAAGDGPRLLGVLPPLYPEWLGDRGFCERQALRFPYVAGAMANGIGSTAIVIAMARAGMLGFFGAAGLAYRRVEAALDELEAQLDKGQPFGINLIHSPHEPALEAALVDLYLRRGVRRVSASAYMDLTPMAVRYAVSGLHLAPNGRILRRNHLFAKISRPEVAARFMAPAPAAIVQRLCDAHEISAEEARLAAYVPVAENITVEADSGGHTDNQALTAVFPTVQSLCDSLMVRYRYDRPIFVGAAGGLGTPGAVAASFALGAAYVLIGSVNQSALESGLSARGKAMLAGASLDDVMMAPAADMFEMGVKVQVLRRGSLFGARALKLYELYRKYASLEELPATERTRLEKDIFRADLNEVWHQTRAFFQERDPLQNERAERDPRHRMALVFRWYLGQSSRWAITGDAERTLDYQIWCGPAMGAFNAWVKNSFLEAPANRNVVQIAKNLLEGAAVITRAQQLRSYGVPVPAAAFTVTPRPLE